MRIWITVLTLALSSSAFANRSRKIDADLKTYDDHVAAMSSAFEQTPSDINNKTWVIKKIQHMVDVDQYMRLFSQVIHDHNYSSDETNEFWAKFRPRGQLVDTANTLDLKRLLKKYGWFRISEYGAVVDGNAWILVQHADHDPDFQKEILPILEKNVQLGETNPRNYAYLFDRIAASWNDTSKRQLQRYGTQGACVSAGVWEPIPLEDPENLDRRRQSVGLEPQADYVKRFKEICR